MLIKIEKNKNIKEEEEKHTLILPFPHFPFFLFLLCYYYIVILLLNKKEKIRKEETEEEEQQQHSSASPSLMFAGLHFLTFNPNKSSIFL
jgi:Ca2+/Na+ antiporter